jgi:hypothetical protein
MTEEACSNCKFYIHNFCHRNPPQQIGRYEWKFPQVEYEDWCGEYVRAPLKEQITNEVEAIKETLRFLEK